jgi:hypothetical protein
VSLQVLGLSVRTPSDSREILGAPAAALGGAILAALSSAVAIGLQVPLDPSGGLGRRLAHHLFDAGHFLAAGLCAAGAVGSWQRWAPRTPGLRHVALGLVALGLGSLLLPDDLSTFAQRLSAGAAVGPGLVLGALVAAFAAALPLALLAGELATRRRRGALGLAAGVALLAAHPFVLAGDYPAVHLYVAWTAATLCAAALAGLGLPRWARTERSGSKRWRTLGLGLASLLAAPSLVVTPRATLAVELLASSGSVLAPYLGRLHVWSRAGTVVIPASLQPWLADRSSAPAVAPSSPRLLPADGVVLLVGIDAMRADLVDSGRYDAELPSLARLRAQSVWFAQARSPGSQTSYALAAVFAGSCFAEQYWTPLGHGQYWPHEDPTRRFPQELSDAGIATVNVASSESLTQRYGLVRGFAEETWVRSPDESAPARAVMDALLAELDAHPRGALFLFAHFQDPHAPYDSARTEGTAFERYRAEVGLVDHELGRLLDRLGEPAWSERSALIVVADHGEAFGEHGRLRHATTLYDELLRVPLLVRAPGAEPRQVSAQVSLMDLGPTVLDLMGQSTPSRFLGQSLVPYLRGADPVLSRPIVAEGRGKQALLLPDGRKVIVDNRSYTLELYDLGADPGEQHNLADDGAQIAEPLGLLRAFFAAHRSRRPGYAPHVRR